MSLNDEFFSKEEFLYKRKVSFQKKQAVFLLIENRTSKTLFFGYPCCLHAQTCNATRVQSATEWTASVHPLHMPKHVM